MKSGKTKFLPGATPLDFNYKGVWFLPLPTSSPYCDGCKWDYSPLLEVLTFPSLERGDQHYFLLWKHSRLFQTVARMRHRLRPCQKLPSWRDSDFLDLLSDCKTRVASSNSQQKVPTSRLRQHTYLGCSHHQPSTTTVASWKLVVKRNE